MKRSVVNILILINVVAFLIDAVFGINSTFGLFYFASPLFHWYQPVTYMFMHAGVWHIFFNMFTLWMFGRTLEIAWGPKRFTAFYFICGIGAAIVQELGQAIGLIGPFDWAVGASGAIYGILLGFGMTFPNERMFVFPFPFPIKAKYFVIIFAAIELFCGAAQFSGDRTAHYAHIGGMLFGALVMLYWRSKMITIKGVRKMKVVYNTSEKSGNYSSAYNTTNYSGVSDTTNVTDYRKIDEILDKIRKGGYNSLTNDEKRQLFEASNKK